MDWLCETGYESNGVNDKMTSGRGVLKKMLKGDATHNSNKLEQEQEIKIRLWTFNIEYFILSLLIYYMNHYY
jgi:hypothetical protein